MTSKEKFLNAIKEEISSTQQREADEIQGVREDEDSSYSHELMIDNIRSQYHDDYTETAIRCLERGLTVEEIKDIFSDCYNSEDILNRAEEITRPE